jgi:hypothetical protein
MGHDGNFSGKRPRYATGWGKATGIILIRDLLNSFFTLSVIVFTGIFTDVRMAAIEIQLFKIIAYHQERS